MTTQPPSPTFPDSSSSRLPRTAELRPSPSRDPRPFSRRRGAGPPLLLVVASLAGIAFAGVRDDGPILDRGELQRLYNDGNYLEAYRGFRARLLVPDTGTGAPDPRRVDDFRLAAHCLKRLGRTAELDGFWTAVTARHGAAPDLLAAVARSVHGAPHWGFRVAGEFRRGPRRGGRGERVDCTRRDRTLALQLLVRALKELESRELSGRAAAEAADTALLLADVLRVEGEEWRLQELTDLAEVPPLGPGYRYVTPRPAPVDAAGQPVLYLTSRTLEEARSDGERWRWALARAAALDTQSAPRADLRLAEFLRGQFAVATLADTGIVDHEDDGTDDGETDAPAVRARRLLDLESLADGETVARLATGVRRFTLPDEFQFIPIFRRLLECDEISVRRDAAFALGGCLENRRQREAAAAVWRQATELLRGTDRDRARRRLEQIVGNWARFESTTQQPAGRPAHLGLRFRNGHLVHLTATRVNAEQLLADVEAHLRSSPPRLDHRELGTGNFAWRIVQKDQQRYLGERVASWSEELEPRPEHHDRTVDLELPIEEAGAYLVTARMEEGNTSHIVLWLNDTVIVRRPVDGGFLTFVADAASGEPLAGIPVEFLGYRQIRAAVNRYHVQTARARFTTDDRGLIRTTEAQLDPKYQWLTVVRDDAGRFAYDSFRSVRSRPWREQRYDQEKAFVITDRPIYRPGDDVQIKLWVRRARYVGDSESSFANRPFGVKIVDPQGDTVHDVTPRADARGGIALVFTVPADARLGRYAIQTGRGWGSFRVEEYRKPEFEVTVRAPDEPVTLGEELSVEVEARYYFDAPVAGGKLTYRVLRTDVGREICPPGPWDWLYGRGYALRRGTGGVGAGRSFFARSLIARGRWWWRPPDPPEVVAEGTVRLDESGTAKLRIDTSLARALHGDRDHRYAVTAEVVDRSRRTIVGTGAVIAARHPFEIFAFPSRGTPRVGDRAAVDFVARRADGQPVAGPGRVRLFAVEREREAAAGSGRRLRERLVREWPVEVREDGTLHFEFPCAAAGRFLVELELADAAGRARTGATDILVRGPRATGAVVASGPLELRADRREVRAGEAVEIVMASDQPARAVLLFPRPSGGVYPAPELVRLEGGTAVRTLETGRGDMPNFFVEALAVHDGRAVTELLEILVPPAKRVLDVTVRPRARVHAPGEPATVGITLTDSAGEPFRGEAVVSIYDAAVEALAGGSNVADIRRTYWGWRRSHRPVYGAGTDRNSWNTVPPHAQGMQDIGLQLLPGEDYDGATFGSSLRGGGGRVRGLKAARAAPTAEASGSVLGLAEGEEMRRAAADAGGAEAPEPVVRTHFADTALWVAAVETDAEGHADVALELPEDLTTWKVQVWALGDRTQVGHGTSELVTRKELMVRIAAPRFFTERDEVVLSAVVHRRAGERTAGEPTDGATGRPVPVDVRLELDGDTLECITPARQTLELAGGSAAGRALADGRVDWRVRVRREGTATVRVVARSPRTGAAGTRGELSDAVERTFPVQVHGIARVESFSGTISPGDDSGSFRFDIPAERRVEETLLEVRWSPTLAGALLDAVPYLADYPYGCTEQTLNRFLPAVLTRRVLTRLGVDLASLRARHGQLDPQQTGDADRRRDAWRRLQENPVFDEVELDRIVRAGVDRLVQMQLSDGGWGWFSGFSERSHAHTTATVLRGLVLAREHGVDIPDRIVDAGLTWLRGYRRDRLAELDGKAKPRRGPRVALTLDVLVELILSESGSPEPRFSAYLERDRPELPAYGLALLGQLYAQLDQPARLAAVMRNLEQYEVRDDENQTLYLELPPRSWWRWDQSETETHAIYLQLLTRVEPRGDRAPRLVKYLLAHRRHATRWRSTRDTALCLEAMAEYLGVTGEGEGRMAVDIYVDGELRRTDEIEPATLLADHRFELSGAALAAGPHTVELRRRGAGPLYFGAALTTFPRGEHIPAAGLDLRVARRVYRLVPELAQATVSGQRGQIVRERRQSYRREELSPGARVTSGDLLEVELTIDAKNDYEYLLFTDAKAAGCEAVSQLSGYDGNALRAYVEVRDREVCFFARSLPRGRHSVAYRLRAEVPGTFSALPARASAMYAPELRGNSDEFRIDIADSDGTPSGGASPGAAPRSAGD